MTIRDISRLLGLLGYLYYYYNKSVGQDALVEWRGPAMTIWIFKLIFQMPTRNISQKLIPTNIY
jgi:hypothetical protein